jgi:hypothetical protein
VINDPIYNFLMCNMERTQVLLVEPQSSVIPMLKQNYAGHRQVKIFNGAIGAAPTMTLYAIRRDEWAEHNARDWPEYRGPTGVTSSKREHVERWLEDHYTGSADLPDVIETLVVESLTLIHFSSR